MWGEGSSLLPRRSFSWTAISTGTAAFTASIRERRFSTAALWLSKGMRQSMLEDTCEPGIGGCRRLAGISTGRDLQQEKGIDRFTQQWGGAKSHEPRVRRVPTRSVQSKDSARQRYRAKRAPEPLPVGENARQ